MNKSIVISTSLFLIISPYLTFYSRYYIHEMIFAVFAMYLIVCLYFFIKQKTLVKAGCLGLLAGLVFATKETSIIVFFSLIVAIILTKSYRDILFKHILTIAVIFILTWILLYSSFFTNPDGILDSILTYKNYFIRSGNEEHTQPLYYYLKLILLNNFKGVLISEIFIIILVTFGIVHLYKDERDGDLVSIYKLISIFSLVYIVVISFIPYKTPWTLLVGWVGIIFLSGYGFYSFLQIISKKKIELIFVVLFFTLSFNLVYQTYLTSYQFPSDILNPYTYSQPTDKIYTLTKAVDKIINIDSEVKINVISQDNQYWPLPWYFRRADNVAWNSSPHSDLRKFDIIIAEPQFTEQISDILYVNGEPGNINLYVPLTKKDIPIRPGRKMSTFIKYDLLKEINQF